MREQIIEEITKEAEKRGCTKNAVSCRKYYMKNLEERQRKAREYYHTHREEILRKMKEKKAKVKKEFEEVNMRLISADAVKDIICKYENRTIQRTMIYEIEKLNGCIATKEQVLELCRNENMEFEE